MCFTSRHPYHKTGEQIQSLRVQQCHMPPVTIHFYTLLGLGTKPQTWLVWVMNSADEWKKLILWGKRLKKLIPSSKMFTNQREHDNSLKAIWTRLCKRKKKWKQKPLWRKPITLVSDSPWRHSCPLHCLPWPPKYASENTLLLGLFCPPTFFLIVEPGVSSLRPVLQGLAALALMGLG